MQPHRRPIWWPEDEPWPPEGDAQGLAEAHGWGSREGSRRSGDRRSGRGSWDRRGWEGGRWDNDGTRHFRGFGCLIVLMATLIVSIGVLVLWLLAGLLGMSSNEGLLATLARSASLVVLVVGIIALIVGVALARRVGRPLSELVDAAGRIEAADYSVRVTESDRERGELRGLSHAFNTMAARLESEDATRRRLLADVSHELRTPLAVIQGNLEALLDGVYPPDAAHIGPILEETRVLERLIDDLRTLSLAESGALPLHRESTEAAVLLEDVAAAHRARARAVNVELRVEAEAALPAIDVDPVRMRQVISNLVDNAIRAIADAPDAQRAGGAIVLRGAKDSEAITLEVADDGPGIPPDLLPSVFERFRKSSSSRGSGLGLAIARAIVTAHGGTIAARSDPGAGGTTIRISLPLG
jgi:two-component system sensor histidine kinase BaeS